VIEPGDAEPACLVDVQKFIDARLREDSFDSFVNFILCAAMAALDREAGGGDLVERAFGPSGEVGRDMRRKSVIAFSVNGVAVPFEAVMRRFYEQWDRLVAEAALAHIKAKLGSRFDDFNSLLDDLESALKKDFAGRLGIVEDGDG
jgi:hypothetical protein